MTQHKLASIAAAAATVVVMASGLVSTAAHAQSTYLGANIGSQSFPSTINGLDASGAGVSGSIYGGYKFSPNFAIEAGVTELGKTSNSAGQIDSYGPYVDLVGIAPLNEQWSLLGSVGIARTNVNTSLGDDQGNTLKLGLGAEYALTKTVSLRGQWSRYQLNAFGLSPNVDQYTIGVRVGF
jgi:OOP family OmpA-OmpF porin